MIRFSSGFSTCGGKHRSVVCRRSYHNFVQAGELNRGYATAPRSTDVKELIDDNSSSDFSSKKHGESVWNITDPERNLVSRFTGWVDVALTERGIHQAAAAGRCLKMFGVYPDSVFTSNLKRSKETLYEMQRNDPEMFDVQLAHSWRLNERHYGSLVGLSKEEAGAQLGHEKVMGWRRSWDLAPPEISRFDMYDWIAAEHTKPITTVHEKGKQTLVFVEKDIKIPSTESLQDCSLRVKPIWVNFIAPIVAQGKTVLVVAHANSIRSMIKHIDEDTLSAENLKNVHIPSATPLVYCFATRSAKEIERENKLKKLQNIQHTPQSAVARSIKPMGQPSKLGMTGRYLVNREVIKLALESTVTISRTDEAYEKENKEKEAFCEEERKKKLHFFDLIDKNLGEIIEYSDNGNGKDEILMITDGRGTITHVNSTFESKIGFLNEEINGRSAKFLQGPLTLKDKIQSLDEKLRTGLPATSSVINYFKNGTAYESKMTIIPIFDWLPTIKGNSCTIKLPFYSNSHMSARENDAERFKSTSGLYMHPSHFIARYEIEPRPDLDALTEREKMNRMVYVASSDRQYWNSNPVSYDTWSNS